MLGGTESKYRCHACSQKFASDEVIFVKHPGDPDPDTDTGRYWQQTWGTAFCLPCYDLGRAERPFKAKKQQIKDLQNRKEQEPDRLEFSPCAPFNPLHLPSVQALAEEFWNWTHVSIFKHDPPSS